MNISSVKLEKDSLITIDYAQDNKHFGLPEAKAGKRNRNNNIDSFSPEEAWNEFSQDHSFWTS